VVGTVQLGEPTAMARREKDELIKASEHLKYEYSMLLAVTEALSAGLVLNQFLKNALLE